MWSLQAGPPVNLSKLFLVRYGVLVLVFLDSTNGSLGNCAVSENLYAKRSLIFVVNKALALHTCLLLLIGRQVTILFFFFLIRQVTIQLKDSLNYRDLIDLTGILKLEA